MARNHVEGMRATFDVCRLLPSLLIGMMAAMGSAGLGEIASAQSGRDFNKVSITLLAPGKPDPADTAVSGYLFRQAANGS